MRVAEPTKRCRGCGQVKPWSAYYAHAKWPDGTMRRPQSRCVRCMRNDRKQRAREFRERMKRDPELRQQHLAQRAVWNRTHRERLQQARADLAAQPRSVPLEISPFRGWLQRYLDDRFAGNKTLLAEHLGVSDSTVRGWLSGWDTVTLDRADEVLCRIGCPELLGELYPALYAETAA